MDLSIIDTLLIVSITPYFLEKQVFWFEKNLNKILEARKTQSFFENNLIFLEKDQKYNLSQLLRKLDEMGYEKVLKVEELGEFSQRGEIIDVFPINLNYAIRLDFFGNKIESISKLPLEIANEKEAKEILLKKLKRQKIYSQLSGLKSGDYLVHLDHGVGIFKQKVLEREKNYYLLEYAAGDKLYVPDGLERKLSRYIGFSEPKISRLGSQVWQKTKKEIKEEVEKFAKELLEIYAKREISFRTPYNTGGEIDLKLASDFKYEETPDQAQAIEDINKDLEKNQPMDRLLCGDVGFGKTEVALRTAIKAVGSGYQVALLSPTTILANQHFQNFRERLKALPVRVAMLSRLQSKKEQKNIIDKLKLGNIDIIIGTHRILSNDIEFQKLGLLIIDDEQRFGVKQKEKLKKIRAGLDVLSLSATPIPRTLYLSISGLRQVSFIQTPPLGRLPIKTSVLPWSEKIIQKAIENEIKRKGQIYYLHNRIETIGTVKNLLENIIPKAKIGVAHGRLSEKELVNTMSDFRSKKIDILVATTIIENGLDLPNVNTLVVADGTRLGLSEAYQIRGRVGRADIQSFAYFLFGKNPSGKAKMRLDALKEAKALGSGYKIALKDLEIRGAGNILGKEQSGNINKVGLNLYCQILADAIERIKTEE